MTISSARKDAAKPLETPSNSTGDNECEKIAGPEGCVETSAISDLPTFASALRIQVTHMSRAIGVLAKELSVLRPDEITEIHVPEARGQLKCAIGDTEEATMSILDSTEAIEALTKQMDREVAAQVTQAVTRIYEACSFQDITGQRICKVVAALSKINDTVQALLVTFGDLIEQRPREERNMPEEPPGAPSEAHLLNGPQSTEASICQDDVDALMAGFE